MKMEGGENYFIIEDASKKLSIAKSENKRYL